METVIQVLEAMGKATAREVAARLEIEPVDALALLREHEETGAVTFINGYWDIADCDSSAPVIPASPVMAPKKTLPPHNTVGAVRGAEPVPVTPKMVIGLLAENGTLNTAELAGRLNRNPRGLGTVLRSFANRGLIVKNGSGKGVAWSLPTNPTEPEPEPAAAEPELAAPAQLKDVAQIISEIPSLTEGRINCMTIPATWVISREIRRTRNRLASLQKLRDAIRVVGRHKHLVQQLVNAEEAAQ